MIFTRAAICIVFLGPASASAAESTDSPPPPRIRAADRLGIVYSPPAAPPTNQETPAEPEATPLVVLPKLNVQGERVDLKEREVLTDKGRLETAKERHLSPLYRKTLGPLSLVATLAFDPLKILGGARANDAEAMALYDEADRVRRKRETEELIELVEELDPEISRELRQTTATSHRPPTPIGERRRE